MADMFQRVEGYTSSTWRSEEMPAFTHRNRETSAFTKVFIVFVLYISVSIVIACVVKKYAIKILFSAESPTFSRHIGNRVEEHEGCVIMLLVKPKKW